MLEVGLGVVWERDAFYYFCNHLDELKKRSQKGENSILEVGGHVWVVRANGTGSARSGGHWKWVLQGDGIQIRIQQRAEPANDTPNVWVIVGSLRLMVHGIESCWNTALSQILALGGRKVFEKVSRVDPCADLPGDRFKEILSSWIDRRFVTRGRKWSLYGEDSFDGCNYLRVGKEAIVFRAYDKALEVQSDETKQLVMIHRRWGGKLPDRALRVEFQLRREFLKGLGVETVRDWLKLRASVLEYLCEKWIRIVDSKDKRNTTRSKLSLLWRHITGLFARWATAKGPSKVEAQAISRKKKETEPRKVKAALKQAFSCLHTAAAAHFGQSAGEVLLGDYLQFFVECAKVELCEKDFREALLDRWNRLYSRGTVGAESIRENIILHDSRWRALCRSEAEGTGVRSTFLAECHPRALWDEAYAPF
jgi:hypothetical protein